VHVQLQRYVTHKRAQVDDRGLYAPGQLFLNRRHIIGKAVAFLPRVGMVTIIMNDYPYVKYLLIGVLCIFVLTSRE
jgi:signal peptidase